jgi:cold shock CspA family protein/ribosome-associated translation inhibitor RaiA
MTVPLQVTFRGFPASPAIEAGIRERAERLAGFHDRIIDCHVVVEAPHGHHAKGKLYHLRVLVNVPGGQVVVSNDAHDKHAHEDVHVAIRDAFNAVDRKLEDFVRRHRQDVKHHVAPAHGRVARLFPDHGFIVDGEGNETYFHRNSVVNDGYDRLEVGAEVRFVAAEGESDKGPQATTVRPAGKHHIVG